MARVYVRLGYPVLPRNFEDIGLENTPQYDEVVRNHTVHLLSNYGDTIRMLIDQCIHVINLDS